METDLVDLQYKDYRLKKKKTEKDEKKELGMCSDDCIKLPENYSFKDTESFWKILISIQKEMGELWYDLRNYNLEADLEIKICNQKKKDLEVIMKNIKVEQAWQNKLMSNWKTCLKEQENPDEAKMALFELRKEYYELVTEVTALEEVVNIDECSNWISVIEGKILKHYNKCKENKEIIDKEWETLTKVFTKATEKYGAEATVTVSLKSETERLTKLTATCESKLCVEIKKEKMCPAKEEERKRCIALDSDNQEVNECQFEKLPEPPAVVPPPPTGEEPQKKVVVWVDGKTFWCDAPTEAAAPAEGGGAAPGATPVVEGEFDAAEFKIPTFDMTNPYVCLPHGVSSYDPYTCMVGGEAYEADYANFREFKAHACD